MKNIILLAFFLFNLSHQVVAEKFYIDNYSIHIDIYQQGYFDVIEIIDVNFTSKSRGIIRSIPFKHKLSNGALVSVKLDNIVVDGDPYNSYTEKGKQNIRIGEKSQFITGPKTYSIKYRVYGAFSPYDTHDEFYWNLIGTQWDVPINQFNFTIDVPKNFEMDDQSYKVLVGEEQSQSLRAEISKSDERIVGKANESLRPNEGLTVGLKFPKGYLQLEETTDKKTEEATKQSPWRDYTFPIPLLLFGLFYRYWKKHGVNKKVTLSDDPIYYPPQNISPPEMGTFIDYVVHDHDVISLIPYWAEQGYLTLEHMSDDELKITKIKALDRYSLSYERSLFQHIFESNDQVLLSDIKNQLYKEIGDIKEEIKEKVNNRSLYDQDAIKKFHSGKMIYAFGIAMALGVICIGFFQFFATGALLIISSFIFLIFHFVQPKLSEQGKILQHEINQFKKTLQNPNQTALSNVIAKDPKYFEKVYPYAVVFGLDESFAGHFEPHISESPTWYVGGSQTNSFDHFKSNFDIQQVQQAFVMDPTQSSNTSSGGFSSSGSAGGGFGGGGGSSW